MININAQARTNHIGHQRLYEFDLTVGTGGFGSTKSALNTTHWQKQGVIRLGDIPPDTRTGMLLRECIERFNLSLLHNLTVHKSISCKENELLHVYKNIYIARMNRRTFFCIKKAGELIKINNLVSRARSVN